MIPTNDDVDQINQEAQELLEEITAGTEALEIDLMEPIKEINALTDKAEADFDAVETDLININETYLAANEKAVAEATARAASLMADEPDEEAV